MNWKIHSIFFILVLLNSKITFKCSMISTSSYGKGLSFSKNKENVIDSIEMQYKQKDKIKVKTNDNGDTCITDYHSPYSNEHLTMRNHSVLFIILFSTILLIGFTFLNFNSESEYFNEAFTILIEDTQLYFIVILIVTLLYLLRAFDSIYINWQILISKMFIFTLYYFSLSSLLILFGYFVCLKWYDLETISKSFKNLKSKYEKILTFSGSTSYIQELYEFLILKTYFITPFFPTLKKACFNSNFKMSEYLKFCYINKLKEMFSLSWMSAIVFICLGCFYNFIETSLKTKLITLMILPIFGLILLIFMYFYFKIVYFRVIPKVTNDNYNEFKDLEEYNQNNSMEKFLNYPLYMESLISNVDKSSTCNRLNKFFRGHNSTFYEDIMILGGLGFPIFTSLMQILFYSIIIWTTLMTTDIIVQLFEKEYSTAIKIIVIAFVLVYNISYFFLFSISLRWFTILDNIETRKNENCINKSINNSIIQNSEISEKIFKSIKNIYYDMLIKKKDNISKLSKETKENSLSINSLNNQFLKRLVLLNVFKFKNITSFDDVKKENIHEKLDIDIKEELALFLKTCGNHLSEEDIQFMLHKIENYDKFKYTKKLTYENLFEICAVMIFLSNKTPEEIYNFVINNYFEERVELLNTGKFSEEGLYDFFKWYKEYFSESEIQFIESTFSIQFKKNKELSFSYITSFLTSLRKKQRN